jgi:gentisate 1,2-dioxygenase
MAVEPKPDSCTEALEAFYAEITARSLDALWRRSGSDMTRAGAKALYAPCLWKWSVVRPYMDRAGELVEPGPEAQRRVLSLQNPTVTPNRGATHIVSAAVQLVLPGDVAPSHRHTMATIRWVLEGHGAMTFVDGEPCSMDLGTLVLTPAWSWHGHSNTTDAPMLWMDSLDVPLIRTLRANLYEEHPGEFQEITKPTDSSLSRYGGGQMRPVWENWAAPVSPLLSYPWTRSEQALRHLAQRGEASPYDDIAFEFTNPATGRSVLPTLACWLQLLRPGIRTKAHRHSSVAVYQVFRGRGATIVDGVQLDWEQGDFFALPPYAWHEHMNGSPSEAAILFSTNDIPFRQGINLYFEDPYRDADGHQEVVAGFTDRYEHGAV